MTIFTTRSNQGLYIHLYLPKRQVRVIFTPVVMFGNTSHARYITSDKEIIEALKKHRDFNCFFFVEKEIEDEVTAPTIEQEQPKVVDYKELCKDKENIVEELSVVDLATAQNWCQRTHGTVFRARKAETIKQEAAEKYNTIFPNLN